MSSRSQQQVQLQQLNQKLRRKKNPKEAQHISTAAFIPSVLMLFDAASISRCAAFPTWVWGLERRWRYFNAFRMSLRWKGASARCDSIIWLAAFYWNERAKVQKSLKKWVWGLDNRRWIKKKTPLSTAHVESHENGQDKYSYEGWNQVYLEQCYSFSEGLNSVV